MTSNFHLSIGVHSIDDSAEFFTRALSATVEHRDPSGYVNIDLFGTQITLKQDPAIDPKLPHLHFGLNLDLATFDRLATRIATEYAAYLVKAPHVIDPDTPLERKKMYVRCPTGYLIEVKSYTIK